MKREILCKDCGERTEKEYGTNPYDGEYCDYRNGNAMFDMICDFCGKDIIQGESCKAWTIYMDRDNKNYVRQWPHEYLAI